MITRHFLTIAAKDGKPARKVHYRRCGEGPALLLVHQSPRSSQEFAQLMEEWSPHFTCIAPDTPGFGHSDALPGEPEVDDFADALADFIQVMGIAGCPSYGFHSGGVILTFVAKRHPHLLSAIACGGFGQWTEAERKVFGERYVPPFTLGDYGEHMVWLWNRIQEQSWFFPWFDLRDEARLTWPHYSVAQTNEIVTDMLNAGETYRYGYAAVLRAPRQLPAPDAPGPKVLITAFNGDPLQDHIDRLGDLPPKWHARKVETPADHLSQSLAFLRDHAGETSAQLVEDAGEGFITVDGCDIHWQGLRDAQRLLLHAPGGELAPPPADAIAIDVPGHGLSDRCDDIAAMIGKVAATLGVASVSWPEVPAGDPALLYPDLTPDRFGAHLVRAWAVARASALFAPWYDARPETAIPVDPAAVAPSVIALRARALLRAGGEARAFHHAALSR